VEAQGSERLHQGQDDQDGVHQWYLRRGQDAPQHLRQSGSIILHRTPKHLRDFILLTNLSKQTHFAPLRNLPRVRCEVLNHQRLCSLQWNNLLTSLRGGSYGSLLSYVQQHSENGFLDEWHPSLLATKANAEDNPTWDEAMNGPFSQGFREACKREFDTLEKKNCWDVVDRPKDRSIVSSTWVFKIKRYPDGSLRKLKARFCARGFEQIEGVDYTETFAPVVNWTTVRFLLMMSILLGLETKQVDYVAAFVQADIDTTVYVEMPRGFAQQGKVLKLKKSLYGLKQSPRNHFNNLSAKLKALGFQSCDADPCLFVSDRCICLVYVDDTLLFARSQANIADVVNGLKTLGMDLEEEDVRFLVPTRRLNFYKLVSFNESSTPYKSPIFQQRKLLLNLAS
jgi:hypothetical protein